MSDESKSNWFQTHTVVHTVYEVKELLYARLCGVALAVDPFFALIHHFPQFAALESVTTLFIKLLAWIHWILFLLLLRVTRVVNYIGNTVLMR